MKKIYFLFTITFLCIAVKAQDKEIKAKIESAKSVMGKFYSQNGKLALVINLDKIEYYYKWRETADTSNIISNLTSWDTESLRAYLEAYRNKQEALAEDIYKDISAMHLNSKLNDKIALK
jgi:hypothetical protein